MTHIYLQLESFCYINIITGVILSLNTSYETSLYDDDNDYEDKDLWYSLCVDGNCKIIDDEFVARAAFTEIIENLRRAGHVILESEPNDIIPV